VIVLAPAVFALGTDEKPGLALVGRTDLLEVPVGAVVTTLGAVDVGRGQAAILGVADVDDLARLLAMGRDHRLLGRRVAGLGEATAPTDPLLALGLQHRTAVLAELHAAGRGAVRFNRRDVDGTRHCPFVEKPSPEKRARRR
jgi:hypothetical protein